MHRFCTIFLCLTLLIPTTVRSATPTPTPVVVKSGQVIYRENDSLVAINADGSRRQVLQFGSLFTALCPAWSRDGKQIAFIGGASEFGVYAASPTGGTPRAILPTKPAFTDTPIGVPAWSPDGKTIAYIGQSGALYFIDATVGKPGKKLDALMFLSADWSPDGSMLAAFGIDTDGKPGLFTLAIDGSNLSKRVALTDADVKATLTDDHYFNRDVVAPRWSPDGKQISYAALDTQQTIRIYLLDLDSGKAQSIDTGKGRAYAPAWSNDGQSLAYVTENGGERKIDVYDMAQKRSGTLAAFRIGGCPVWKPNK